MNNTYSIQYMDRIENLSNKCSNCGLCKSVCQLITQSPIEVLRNPMINADIAFACTQCGLCNTVCPEAIQVSKLFLIQRQELLGNKSHPTRIHGLTSVRLNQRLGFSKLLKTSQKPHSGSNLVFMPGCSLSSFSPQLVLEVYNHLQQKKPGIGILLTCCGSPSQLIGDEARHNHYYASFLKDLEDMGWPEVITSCPSCYRTLSELSPNLRVSSLWELLMETGLPTGSDHNLEEQQLILHDPCPTRACSDIHNAVRDLLVLAGFKINEFSQCREHTVCCGLGGMVGATNPSLFKEHVQKRIAQAGSDTIVTYCASCVNAFRSEGSSSWHLLELLFQHNLSLTDSDGITTNRTTSRWVNRLRLKRQIQKQYRQGD